MTIGFFSRPAALWLALVAGPSFAIQTCELDGQSISPNNGNTTAGKSGLMRCKDADSGAIVREQQLQNGRFMGVERYYQSGQVEREFSVDERGNKEGLSREWTIGAADGKRVLTREETDRNGSMVGLAKTWYPTGQRRRLAFYGDDGHEQASAEFTADGKLYDLRCTTRPVFGTDFDDRSACGFAGATTTVLYGGQGQPSTRIAFDHGERRRTETLWDNGAVRELREIVGSGGIERSFSADGTKRHEVQWVVLAAKDGGANGRRVNVLDQEFHESGKLIHERRWTPSDRGGDLVSESRWYLNGQLSSLDQYVDQGDKRTRRETGFHDNGKPSSEGTWLLADARSDRSSSRSSLPIGTHKTYDEQGRERGERLYDDRGRLTREREFDERGTLVRDDEVFEDGSRKSAGR